MGKKIEIPKNQASKFIFNNITIVKDNTKGEKNNAKETK